MTRNAAGTTPRHLASEAVEAMNICRGLLDKDRKFKATTMTVAAQFDMIQYDKLIIMCSAGTC